MTRVLIVVEASDRAFSMAVEEVQRNGGLTVEGWQPKQSIVCTGILRDADDAADALLAAVAGAGLVVHAQAPRDVVDSLVDDLRRLGPVQHLTAEPTSPRLTSEERRLLDALADGQTLSRAAAELHLSRRTADRRLQAAKKKLRVSSTAEAIVAHRSQQSSNRVGGDQLT